MKKALQTFVNGLVDYGGVAQTAKMPFGEVYANFLQYRKSGLSGILARFVLPVEFFAPFCETLSETPQPDNPVRVAVIGGAAHQELTDTEEFALELSYLKMLSDSHPDDLRIETYEVLLSHQLMSKLWNDPHRDEVSPRLSDFGEGVVEALSNRENDRIRCFFEVPFNGFSVSAPSFENAIIEFARINERLQKKNNNSRIGIKLRCSGKRIPASYAIAEVIAKCVEKGVPFTAVMDAPHPFFSNSRDDRHGFVSLFAAGILTAANQLTSIEQIVEIVSDGNPEHFVFTDDELIWDNRIHATCGQIAAARNDVFISFGSSSFDEGGDLTRFVMET